MDLLNKQIKPKSTISFLSDEFINDLEEDKYLIEESFKKKDKESENCKREEEE